MASIRNNASVSNRVPAWDEAFWSEGLETPITHSVLIVKMEQHVICTFTAGVTCS